MRAGLLPCLAGVLLLAACGPPPGTPKRANASKVAENHPQAALLWPAMLQHCLRSPECDPMSKFSEGAGQASGIEGSATWFAERTEEGGSRILVSFHGYRGQGGEAGRPLASSETPRNLRGRRDNRSWVTVDYRIADGRAVAMAVRLRSPQVVFTGLAETGGVRRQAQATQEFAAALRWPDGQQGARLELAAARDGGTPATVLSVQAIGSDAGALLEDREMVALPSTPWLFDLTLDLAKSPGAADALLGAIGRGDPLAFRILTPTGAILRDSVYTDGLEAALTAAQAALDDPAIAQPLTERCLPYVSEPMSFWSETPDVSPAAQTCDSRTPEQRAQSRAE